MFDEGSPTTTVEISSSDPSFTRTFTASNDSIRGLFNGDWSTGYFSVSHDGPILINSRLGETLVVCQRAQRHDQTILWGRGSDVQRLSVTTPWTIGLFVIGANSEGSGGGSQYLKDSYLYTSTGPALGAYTQLRSAYWMGNVYQDSRICWGTTSVNNRDSLSIASTMNFMNDFYNEAFTPDISGTTNPWLEFTETGNNTGSRMGTLGSVINRIWENRQ
tara:strand:- start:772 stop:1425 length:654 start_codon:yes stop_codon:yes gene_type:complete